MADFNDWKVDTITPSGKITQIFGNRKDEFTLYEVDNQREVRSDTHKDIGPRMGGIQSEWTEASMLLTTTTVKARYVKRMASALSECYLGHEDIAKEKLGIIIHDIHDFKTTRGRIAYVQGSYILASAILVALGISLIWFTGDAATFVKVVIAGVFGGVLSVSVNLNTIVINTRSGNRWMQSKLGASRVVISAVSSIIVFILIKSGLVLGVFEDTNPYLYYAFGAISGFSENYVANILRKKVKEVDE